MNTTLSNSTTNSYGKITALYERLSIGDERNGKDKSNSIKHQKEQLEAYAKQNGFVNIKHYTDDAILTPMMESILCYWHGIIIITDRENQM